MLVFYRFCCPDISQGRLPLPEVSEMGYPVANRELRRGYIQSWNFIIEQKLPGQFVTSVGYVGTASVNGFAFLDINASQIPGSGDDGRPLFAQFGRTAATREWAGRDVQMESFFECRRTGSRPKADVRVGLANSTAVILSNLAMDEEPVRQRTAEIGLRIALGAEPCGIFRLVIGQGLSLSAAGIAIGFVTAAGLTRVMKSMLVGITATDPGTFALGAAI